MTGSSSDSMHRTVGVLVILGILVGMSGPGWDGSQDGVLFVELTFEQASGRKASRRRFSPRTLHHTIWLFTCWHWILRMLVVAGVFLHHLHIVLLWMRRSEGSCPTPACRSCPVLHSFLENDPLVQRYQRLFDLFDFSFLPTLAPSCIPLSAFLKAYLVMVDQKIQTFTLM